MSRRNWRFVGKHRLARRVDDLLNALDGFLCGANDILDRLADYYHGTERIYPRARLATLDTLACQFER